MEPFGLKKGNCLKAGEVGYFTASIKNVKDTRVGDTVTNAKEPCAEALPGYKKVNPMVFCGMYPADEDDLPVFVGRFNIGAVSLHLPMITGRFGSMIIECRAALISECVAPSPVSFLYKIVFVRILLSSNNSVRYGISPFFFFFMGWAWRSQPQKSPVKYIVSAPGAHSR